MYVRQTICLSLQVIIQRVRLNPASTREAKRTTQSSLLTHLVMRHHDAPASPVSTRNLGPSPVTHATLMFNWNIIFAQPRICWPILVDGQLPRTVYVGATCHSDKNDVHCYIYYEGTTIVVRR